jgi:hypothetical protein
MAVNRGVAGVGTQPSVSIKVEMSKLYELEPEATPLVAITQRLKKSRSVRNPRFDIQELRPLAQSTTANSYLVGATSVVVADASIFNVNDRVVNLRTFENLLVTAVDTGTNTLTVTRAFGETAAAAGNNNDVIVRIGNVSTEGASIGSMALRQEDNAYNYCQIFREPYELTNTAKVAANYTGDLEMRLIRQLGRKIKGDLEFAGIFGERSIANGSTANARRATRGIKPWITTNTYNPAGTMTETAFAQNVLVPAGRYGSSEKILFAGENILRCLHYYGQQKMNNFQEDNTLGFKCMRYRSPFVDLLVVRHPLFRDAATAQMGLIIDPENVCRVYMEGRDLQLLKNRQANDLDGIKGEMLADTGWEVTLEETHMFLNGITGPA